ncbi:MAG: type II toxin-antitoxin system HicA family toxin [Candidatus Saccharibacteria bacterium]|nr:type II toxin-antitoxin system HicA family toxin [Candidatus Saccharibacteria bacterium]
MNYKGVKQKRLVRYLKRLGFINVGGHSHDKYLMLGCDKEPIIVPRHAKDLSPGVVDQISKILVETYDISKSDVLNNLK